MKEREFISPDNFLDGVDWGDYEKTKAVITQIHHDHGYLSVVYLAFEGEHYQVLLDTYNLDLDEAEAACQNVPEWWNESKNTGGVYNIQGMQVIAEPGAISG